MDSLSGRQIRSAIATENSTEAFLGKGNIL